MKIKREKLLALITGELARLKTTRERKDIAEKSRTETVRAHYERSTRDAWQRLAEMIERRTAAREPVEWEYVPADLRGFRTGQLKFYDPPRPGACGSVEDSLEYRRLDALRRLLEVAEDEMVSTYALEKAGFRLEHIMRTAAEIW